MSDLHTWLGAVVNADGTLTLDSAMDLGTNNVTTGGKIVIDVDGTAIDAAGSITFGAGADDSIYHDGTSLTLDCTTSIDAKVAGTSIGTWDAGGIDIVAGDTYAIAGTDVLTATTLGSGVVNSSLTSVGTLGATSTSGLLTSTVASGEVLRALGGTTGEKSIRVGTTSNSDFYVGTENGSGSFFGGTAYAATLYNAKNTPMEFYVNATKRMTITAGGLLQYGSHSAVGAETITGYITINDSGGTSRKLAVIS